jgi:hypothetical protein
VHVQLQQTRQSAHGRWKGAGQLEAGDMAAERLSADEVKRVKRHAQIPHTRQVANEVWNGAR